MPAPSKMRPEKGSGGQLRRNARGQLVETTSRRIIFGGPASTIRQSRSPPLTADAAAIAAMPTHDANGRRLSTRERLSLGRATALASRARASDVGGSVSAPSTPPRPGSSRAPIEVLSSPGSPAVVVEDFRRPSKLREAAAKTRIRLRSIPEAMAGVREAQIPPVAPANLWLTAARPPTLVAATGHLHQMCGICYEVKAHPVSYRCGHSHCYVCVRMWLEKSWRCPEPLCGERMHEAPFRHEAEEQALAATFPGWCTNTTVSYSWAGLTFPKPKGFAG
ncbi:hypothetical protein C8F04DRAFT_1263938 [Mycena alexandri]|uniref:RING-type domain-containing protein n=1 Tax=Mycena alexandri TaxID=1745969 RepID=A0AAD6SQ32_9AGAR|nr:hypothetical protein C8F04DRAFT_1263938 [Mycena alexandri]